ncbi:hypothetical protein OIO90_000253 [Microbotryomycetes sp. JL221]|nr:hypothetical protein OIO90_000253 [Microbotryomycetes sp. JL221]
MSSSATTGSNGSSSDSVDRLFEAVEQTFAHMWNLVTTQAPNLHDLPHQINDTLQDLINKVTNNGTLPLPTSWRDAMGSTDAAPHPSRLASSSGSSSAAASTTTPRGGRLNDLTKHMQQHPYWTAAILTTTVTGTAYYFAPQWTRRSVLEPVARPLKQFVPVRLLPTTNRPIRLVSAHGDEQRREAVLVLGAQNAIVADLALDLEHRGFVVIATVSNPKHVDQLEKQSRGWIKVLVLDPVEASSVAPFLRSLSTALSLRFPLHTSGDPYASPSQALALTAVVNCLSLCEPPSSLCPVEGFDGDDVRRAVGERVATAVGVIKGILPILRTTAGRPGQPNGTLISLVPAPSANVALPFMSLASAADAAITSILHSLRRELSATRSSNVRIQILETGFFDAPSSNVNGGSRSMDSAPLPVRLQSLYAPALSRRSITGFSGERGGNGFQSNRSCSRRKVTQPRKLSNKVFNMIVHERGGRLSSTGAGSLTYRLASFLPHLFVDLFFSIQDRLLSMYLSHRSRLRSSSSDPSLTTSTPSSINNSSLRSNRPPLPSPPTAQHPTALRPGHSSTATSQIPIDMSFAAAAPTATHTDSQRDVTNHGYSTASSSVGDGEDTDSLDGDLMSSSQVEGSFVQIDRKA